MQYSKQWCDIWEPTRKSDFDVEAIVKNMYRERYYPIICEGLKFKCIHKDGHGNIWLGYIENDGYYSGWKKYTQVLNEEKIKRDESNPGV